MTTCFCRYLPCAVVAIVWSAGVRAEGQAVVPPRLAASVHHYQHLEPQQQADWLRDLFQQRSLPACRIAYPPAEVQRQQRRQQAVLERIAAGRQLKTEGLVRLLDEVDRQERAAIHRLWRDFEFSTAQAFHGQRSEFEKRMDARRLVLKRWYDAGQPWQQQPALIRWLQAAVAQQQKDPQLALPASPSFSSSGELSVEKMPEPAEATPAPTQPAPSRLAPDKRAVASSPPAAVRPAAPRSVRPTAARAAQTARVDVGELQARLTGYNLAVAHLISQLHEDKTWTAEQLSEALDTLAELQILRRDLELYRNAVPAATRGNLSAIESTATAFSLLSAKTAAARRQLEGDGTRPAHSAQTELVRLERVSHRLAQLATEQ